jgi:hypothetical protein
MTTDINNIFKDLGRADREMAALTDAIEENGGVECAQVPHVFYPEDFHTSSQSMAMVRLAERTAREICMRCPVIAQCLRVGLREEFGIWGGTSPEQRRRIKRQQQI